MRRAATGLAVLSLLLAAPVAAAGEDEPAPCYDAAVIGKYLGTSAYVNFNDVLAPPEGSPDAIWWGGFADFRIRVLAAAGRKRVPSELMTVKVTTASEPLHGSALTFYLKKRDDGGWSAIAWGWADRDWRGEYSMEATGMKTCRG